MRFQSIVRQRAAANDRFSTSGGIGNVARARRNNSINNNMKRVFFTVLLSLLITTVLGQPYEREGEKLTDTIVTWNIN